jgi:subtilisin-like proprotein convertase family protein
MKKTILFVVFAILVATAVVFFGVRIENSALAQPTEAGSPTQETQTANVPTTTPSNPAQDQPTSQNAKSSPNEPIPVAINIPDAGAPRDFEIALDQAYTKNDDGKGSVVAVQAASPAELETIIANLSPSHAMGAYPVLYERGVERNEFTRRIVTNKITVKLAEGADPSAIAAQAGATSYELPPYAPGFAVLEMETPFETLRASSRLAGQPTIESAEPQLARQQAKRAMPNDALINQQWHLKFNNQSGAVAGTDLNIESVWAYPTAGAGFRGRGVRIGIVDDGVQTNHPDFIGNIDTANDYDWNDSTPNDPSPGAGDDHGTACAGDAAARGNNSIGVSGSAPEATIVGMRLIAAGTSDSQEAEAMSYLPQLIQILSNSWGPSDTGTILEAPGPLTKSALKTSTETGRGGKGTIITWAGGNGRESNDNSNYDGYANSIYTIAVGAFDSLSRQSYYSEPGANLVITSPSNGTAPALGKTTTDRTGSAGYVSGDYESDFGGTSSATPTASGVIALMLEANPNLGWRDVQEILMRSAKKVNPSDTDWKTPVAPHNINHNHKFGGGLIDATAAVSLSGNWTNLGPQLSRVSTQNSLSVAIPNQNPTGITREFTIAPSDNLRVEHVTVTVSITHTARGNLNISLTSPSGTVSRLAEVRSDSNDNYASWTFMTVRNWGENAVGTWRLKISDESNSSNSNGGTLTAASIEIFGSSTAPINPAPTVVLTNPASDTTISPGTSLTLNATATDLTASGANGTVTSVSFLSNGTVLSTDTTAPYSFNWTPSNGTYSIAARATDSENATATTPPVTVTVANRRPSISTATVSPSGSAFSDQSLGVTGLVASDPDSDTISYSYQWQSSLNNATFTDAPGETSQTLAASANRTGLLWRSRITPSDTGGAGEAFLTSAVAINRRPPTTATPGQPFSYDSDLFLRGSETSFTRAAILSEFSQGPSGGSAEWVEFLVLKPGSLRGWKIQDAGGGTVTLADVPAWDNIPAGTLVVIYNGASKDPLLPADDSTPGSDLRMIVSSSNTSLCTGSWPSLSNNGDGILLRDSTNTILSQVGFGTGTTTPNIGAVGGSKSANFRGNTEDGWQQASNWSIETSTTARAKNTTQVLSEDFSSLASGGNTATSGTGSPSSSEITSNLTPNFPLSVKAYQAGGAVKLGTSSLSGSISSKSLDLSAGNYTVSFKVKGWSTIEGNITVTPSTGSAQTVSYTQTISGNFEQKSLSFAGGTSSTTLTFATTAKRAFLDDIVITTGSGGGGNSTSLTLSLSPSTFLETAGANASTATLSISQAPSQNLTANLSSSDTSELTVPATATIPAGQTSITFPVTAIDDDTSDGPQTVTLTAASGNLSATTTATVTDNEVSLNGVTPGSPNGGDNTIWIDQLRSGALNQPALFRLAAGNPAWLSINSTTGLVSGTPTSAGNFTITIERFNSLGETATQSFLLSIPSASNPTFAEWAVGLSNPAPNADPDSDGIPNLLEYFLGLDATARSSTGIVLNAVGGNLTMDYPRSKALSGSSGRAEWTASFSGWSTANVTDSLVTENGTHEIRRATVPIQQGESKKFLRLRVTTP